jgi:hypothetical protein
MKVKDDTIIDNLSIDVAETIEFVITTLRHIKFGRNKSSNNLIKLSLDDHKNSN